jgi:CRISPR/Cas system-associated exonuclease Cas4 (RecB family)
MTRPPRQTRLDVGDPEGELGERWANYRVLRKAFVSATALSSFHHCAVKPFLERVLAAAGMDTQTWAMRQGLRAHEEVQAAFSAAAAPSHLTFPDALRQGAFLFAAEYPLRDERRLLRGIADLVFAARGQAHVVELKNARPPDGTEPTWGVAVRPEHALQLAFYGLLARNEFGRMPQLTLVYLQGGSKQALLEGLTNTGDAEAALQGLVDRHPTWSPTREHLQLVNDTIRNLRRVERRQVLPRPSHADPATCARCPVRSWCPRRLDRPGEFQHLAAALVSPTE